MFRWLFSKRKNRIPLAFRLAVNDMEIISVKPKTLLSDPITENTALSKNLDGQLKWKVFPTQTEIAYQCLFLVEK